MLEIAHEPVARRETSATFQSGELRYSRWLGWLSWGNRGKRGNDGRDSQIMPQAQNDIGSVIV
ncbi:hypothetical protein JMJ77_0003872 [Colletotrichum scovillei]|uniref:Uncharacterized protein n=1 Tax=Colletotrichum scovillei TaxID=1209932 RepID=A0A9P7U8J3_9PEZI|nr:hypothetical protein JMJ77_0003872 [Colletotrichum scovillei]KAG7049121.1 hypothetical protein JMJ78_0013104 [Colletotrichum scovillei]KAG7063862.1 hypothetical protein JMJ76_0006910 [Colletotrichum scovillei]